MKIKSYLALGAVALSLSPLFAYAINVDIKNETTTPGTGKFENGLCPCSSNFGGVAQPHGKITLPDAAIGLYCPAGKTCYAKLFANKNCTNPAIARVKLNQKEGVLDIENLDANYVVAGSGTEVTISEVSHGILGWLKSIF